MSHHLTPLLEGSIGFAYVGGIPGEPPGVLQVNVTVDPGTPVGNQPIVVKVGQASSQPNLTVAIQ